MADHEPRVALLAGASGLVGGYVLEALLDAPDFGRVFAISRRPLGREHPRLANRIVQFDKLETQLKGQTCHVAFCCLGTTLKQAGSRAGLPPGRLRLRARLRARGACRRRPSASSWSPSAGAEPAVEALLPAREGRGGSRARSHAVSRRWTSCSRAAARLARGVGRSSSLAAPAHAAGQSAARRAARAQYRGISARTVAAAMLGAARSGRRGVYRYTYAALQALAAAKPVRVRAARHSEGTVRRAVTLSRSRAHTSAAAEQHDAAARRAAPLRFGSHGLGHFDRAARWSACPRRRAGAAAAPRAAATPRRCRRTPLPAIPARPSSAAKSAAAASSHSKSATRAEKSNGASAEEHERRRRPEQRRGDMRPASACARHPPDHRQRQQRTPRTSVISSRWSRNTMRATSEQHREREEQPPEARRPQQAAQHRADQHVAREESGERPARPVPVERARRMREVPDEPRRRHERRGVRGDPQPHDEHGDDVRARLRAQLRQRRPAAPGRARRARAARRCRRSRPFSVTSAIEGSRLTVVACAHSMSTREQRARAEREQHAPHRAPTAGA